MIDEDLLWAPMHDLARLIQRRKLSPIRLIEGMLARKESLAQRLEVFAAASTEGALAQAEQAERELSLGLRRGPLHGIPFAVHEYCAVIGEPQAWWLPSHTMVRTGQEAAVVTRLRKAGAICMGRCATTGPTGALNPWDLTGSAGGLSGALAAVVSSGMVTFCVGTEPEGFLLLPSSLCGVCGFRPTFGAISRTGFLMLTWTMDTPGLIAHDAWDCCAIFNVLKGRDPADAMSIEAPFRPALKKAKEHVAGMRIGVVKGDEECTPEVTQALAETVSLMRSCGASVREVLFPRRSSGAIAAAIMSAELGSACEELLRPGTIPAEQERVSTAELRGARTISAVDYLRCQRIRALITADFVETFSSVDLLIAPAFPTSFRGSGTIMHPCATELWASLHLAGLPALTIPCGFRENMPIGACLIGRTSAEAEVLGAAHAFQSMTEWHLKRPRL